MGLLCIGMSTAASDTPGGDDPYVAMSIEQYVGDRSNGLVDFSYAGYAANERAIPDATVRVVVPNTDGDDGVRIQAALDYVGSLAPDAEGLRGVVLLKPGDYEVSGQLVIKVSGVVLRGSGPGENGTRLIATGRQRRSLIRLLGQDNKTFGTSSRVQGHVRKGSLTLELADASHLKPGDWIMVTRPSTEDWIVAIGMSKFWVAEKAPRIWKAGELDITWDRTVQAVEKNKVTLDAPLSMNLDPDWGGGNVTCYTWPGRITQVGIENLQMISTYDIKRPKDEDHAWVGITLEHVRDTWVRDVTFRHFVGSAVSVWESASRVTVVDCKSLEPVSENGGWRRHTFFTAGQQTLFLRCFSEYGRHDFSVGHCAPGPNAFVHCNAHMALDDSGPIGAWATGVLYDNVNIDGHGLRLGYRGIELQFSGWTAANCMLWQCTAAQVGCYKPPMTQNWAIGCWAMFEGDGHWAAFNEFVNPKSLMEALVTQRVGAKAGEFIGKGVIHPPGSTSPKPEQALSMVANSHRPAPQLIEVIVRSIKAQALSVDATGCQTIDHVLIQHPELSPPKPQHVTHPLTLINGQFKVGKKCLSGKTLNTYWWRGRAVPQSIEFKRTGPKLTRFVPGRVGMGWTDDLDILTSWMTDQDIAAVFQHHGLWYDRRREDHQRVRRLDGEVWPPFDEMPFARSGQGTAWDGLSRYDLTRYNPWYFDRLKIFAQNAEHKGLVLLNNHYFQHNILEAGAHWADFPWRSANNINNTGFPEPPPYAGDKRIFQAHLFYDVTHLKRRKLHQAYIRHHLKVLSDCPNVIHMTSGEYTGSLEFTQFWLDTIIEWQQETGNNPLIGLSCTKDVQDALLEDPMNRQVIDVIDIRYWWYQSDGKLYAPKGGQHLSPRQHARLLNPKRTSFEQVFRAVYEYRTKYPNKAVLCSADSSFGWAVLMAEGAIPNIPKYSNIQLSTAIPQMKAQLPVKNPPGQYVITDTYKNILVYASISDKIQLDLSHYKGIFNAYWIDPGSNKIISTSDSIETGAKVKIPVRFKPCVLWLRQ